MTIAVAVTGGIGAGKSTVSRVLGECGAVVVDSDRLAREVVAVGTPGLAVIADQFGSEMIAPDGALDRPALAAVVFADPAARRRLEAITHPLVRARFATLQRAAPAGSVVVNDIPLLTTRAAASAFNLVIGVGAPVEFRVQRLVDRGLTADDAVARISAQIDDDARRLLCDIWIDNSTEQVDVRRAAEAVWSRLSTYAANVESGRPAARPGPRLVPYSPAWPEQAGRLMERVRYLVGDHRVDHIGSTAVPGFPAKDVIDLQLTVDDLAQLDEFAPLLAAGGFPLLAGIDHDNPHPDQNGRLQPDVWRKALHVNADPGLNVNLHLRLKDSPGWLWSLRFRDWLRAKPVARTDYLLAKERASAGHAYDTTVDGYAHEKETFLAAVDPEIRQWAETVGWTPT